MKHKIILITWLVVIATILGSGCKKNKLSELDKLPPETQTGANTFGCLVNGQAFKPGGAQLSGGSLGCNYQNLGSGANGGYYFRLSGTYRNNSNGSGSSVGLFTDSLKIEEGVKYNLKIQVKGNPYALYTFYNSSIPFQSYDTDGSLHTGELWIKKLDSINQIVSGTFWFDAVNANGQKVEVRSGRFDMQYTR